MRHGANAVIIGRRFVILYAASLNEFEFPSYRIETLEASAKELSEATGKTCIAAQADVRQPQQLYEAVNKAITEFGRIDYVVCGLSPLKLLDCSGAVPYHSFYASYCSKVPRATFWPQLAVYRRMASRRLSKSMRYVMLIGRTHKADRIY